MARAGSSDITHTSAPSRRGLLQSASAAVVASSIGTNEASAGETLLNPEFEEWQRLALETRDWYASDEYQQATDQEARARIDPLWERMRAIEEVIFQKPVSSGADAMMLGVVALYWNDDSRPGTVFLDGGISGFEPDACMDAKSSGYLIRAVCVLAKASGLFRALDGSKFDRPPGA